MGLINYQKEGGSETVRVREKPTVAGTSKHLYPPANKLIEIWLPLNL